MKNEPETKWNSDVENYRLMNEPHESDVKAAENLKSFYNAISSARKEFKISDVIVITQDSFKKDNDFVEFLNHTQFGNRTNGLKMAAWLYGTIKAEHNEEIESLLNLQKKTKK